MLGVLAASALFDPIEANRGFGTGFRITFSIAAVLALLAVALTPTTE